MKNDLKKLMGENYYNVGKYYMEHPKITHGTLKFENGTDEFNLKLLKSYKLKVGITRSGFKKK